MKLVLASLLIWMFNLLKSLNGSESLSFSFPIDSFISPTTSFWNGTIPSKLLKESLRLDIYLNKPQGLLFYAIDNVYQSVWIELDKSEMIISYFNFKTKVIDEFRHDTSKLCRLSTLEDAILLLKFSLLGSVLMINCNQNEERIFYSPNIDYINNFSLKIFLEEMKKPVPFFESFNTSSQPMTYLWIGNTPEFSNGEYRNNRLETLRNNLLGCVQHLSRGNLQINLTTTGSRNGNMIEAPCRPICDSKPCYNGSRCVEGWRQRFNCQCGLSKFIGVHCNESYNVEFRENNAVNIFLDYKLQNFQITFNQLKNYNKYEVAKLFSIQFIFNQSLYFYIDAKGYMQIKFVSENLLNYERRFQNQIENNRTYTVFIEASMNGMKFKLADSHYLYIIDEKIITHSASSLIATKISVGDSHSVTMKWMKRFNGCISNLMLTDGKRTFVWNTIPDFDKLPTCDNKILKNSLRAKKNITDVLLNNVSPSFVNINKKINDASTTYIIIGIVMSVLVVIIIIIIISYIIINNKNSRNKKKPKEIEKVIFFENVPQQSCLPPNSPTIHYKPPYKARSISYSSNVYKSVTSLPISVTPTLVTPEEEC